MATRRSFLAGLPLLGWATQSAIRTEAREVPDQASSGAAAIAPLVISTWNHGLAANAAAWEILGKDGFALDAVEAAVRVSEADPEVRSVGLGGYPDRDGHVTLDASIMDDRGRCGSVAYLQNILHPISVARAVMEHTPHVMLVGQGAYEFAKSQGHPDHNLLTAEAKEDWERWKREKGPERPAINIENHDTIGLLALDSRGRMAGACTTSGASYKYAGRVGDSPIIGAGLYVDNEIGAATATGWGEAVIRACGSFLVVELMRQGLSPQQACEAAVQRVVDKNPDWKEIQVGFIALDKQGRVGAFAIAAGFQYALQVAGQEAQLIDCPSLLP